MCRFMALVERDVMRATNDIGRVLAKLDLNGIIEEEEATLPDRDAGTDV
jgi:hypothetical protein